MSNPLVNRWGLNIYWPKLWYSDKNYTLNLKQDNIIFQLIKFYFFFGIHLPQHLFLSKYWYYKLDQFRVLNHLTSIQKYYRWYGKKISLDGEKSKYKVRNMVKDIFPMKIWIFKFSNWILINFYWFQPIKKSYTKLKRVPSKRILSLNIQQKTQLSTLRRLKLFLSKDLYTLFLRRTTYIF